MSNNGNKSRNRFVLFVSGVLILAVSTMAFQAFMEAGIANSYGIYAGTSWDGMGFKTLFNLFSLNALQPSDWEAMFDKIRLADMAANVLLLLSSLGLAYWLTKS